MGKSAPFQSKRHFHVRLTKATGAVIHGRSRSGRSNGIRGNDGELREASKVCSIESEDVRDLMDGHEGRQTGIMCVQPKNGVRFNQALPACKYVWVIR